MLTIAITGKKGSGKGTIAEYLQKKYNATLARFSKTLDDILARLFIPNTRDNLINLALSLRKLYGNDVLAQVLKKNIILEKKNTVVVIDGVRYKEEFEILKTLPNFKLMAITTEVKLRFVRTKSRNEKADDRQLSWDQFQKQESRDTEIHIDTLINGADIIVENNGNIDELYHKIDHIINEWQK